MRNENLSNIILRIKESKHLFVSTETPPFGVDGLPISGIDYLVNQLSFQKALTASTLIIQLPAPLLAATRIHEIQHQILQLCRYKIEQIENEQQETVREGFYALRSGGIFLAGSLFLATLVQRLELLPDLLQEFAVEGLLIVGWVGLWHPIELLIYGLWPYRKEKRIYEHIARMQIELVPDTNSEN
jgi:hypothetical protein